MRRGRTYGAHFRLVRPEATQVGSHGATPGVLKGRKWIAWGFQPQELGVDLCRPVGTEERGTLHGEVGRSQNWTRVWTLNRVDPWMGGLSLPPFKGCFQLPPARSLTPQRGSFKSAQGNALDSRLFRIES